MTPRELPKYEVLFSLAQALSKQATFRSLLSF
jgi:hypothetical protein